MLTQERDGDSIDVFDCDDRVATVDPLTGDVIVFDGDGNEIAVVDYVNESVDDRT